jgi:pyrroloquinoline quinone (PQQ) biosynthesis protein C
MATRAIAGNVVPVSEEIIAIRDRWHCMNHPFYDRLAEGKLDIKHLGSFLAQHYVLVNHIFRSLGITYSKSPTDVARFIVENLAEEAGLIGIEGGEAHDHGDLIFRFTRYCGMKDDQVRNTEQLPTWYARAASYWWLAQSDPAIVRIALQATQESQLVGENGGRVVPALTTHYGFTKDSPEIHFFVEHATADVKHGNAMLVLVDRHVTTPELRDRVVSVVEQLCKLRYASFTELYRVTHLGESVLDPKK